MGLLRRTITHSPTSTEQLAEKLGSRLKGGEVIELISDLGGGKTTFVRGLVRGIGSPDKVSSPSFTLSNEYRGGKFPVYHFDFYRLGEPGIMQQEIAEIVADPDAVTVVEWADIVEKVLPADRLVIRIKATDENERELSFEYPEILSYLLETGD